METASSYLTRPCRMDWFGSDTPDHHGNMTSSKRPGSDDSRYPPKKRALLEHRARESRQRDVTEGDENVNPSLYPTNLKHEVTEMLPRPRSDSLHSDLSVVSDNSDTMSTLSREDSPFLFHNLYDHRTPERQPLRSLNTQIAKPLFTNISNDCYVGDRKLSLHSGNTTFQHGRHGDKSQNATQHPGNTTFQHGRHGDKSQNATQHPGNRASQNGRHSDQFENTLHHPVTSEAMQVQSKFQAESDKTGTETEGNTDKSVLLNNATTNKADNNYSNDHSVGSDGNHGNTRQYSYTGAMVSLIHRFNAEAAAENQSDSQLPVTSAKNQSDSQLPVTAAENQSDSQLPVTSAENQSDSQLPVTSAKNQSDSQLPVTAAENQSDSQLPVTASENQSDSQKNPKRNEMSSLSDDIVDENEQNQSEPLSLHQADRAPNMADNILAESNSRSNNNEVVTDTAPRGDNCYRCEHCPREFRQYNNLRRHVRVHRAAIYQCTLCERQFNEQFYLTMHMSSHTGHRVYRCGVCHAHFTSSSALKTHVATHSPSKLHTCEECGKSFSKACVLRQHRKGHSGARPHQCEVCSKTFIHRHHLTMHLRSHTDTSSGKRPDTRPGAHTAAPVDAHSFTCDICNRSYTESSHLYQHLCCHDNENDRAAVKAIKERLNKMSSEKISVKGRTRKTQRAKTAKKVHTEEESHRHVSRSQHGEMSRSLMTAQAGEGAMIPCRTSQSEIYNTSLPTFSLPHSSLPTSSLPHSSLPHSSLPQTNVTQSSQAQTSLPAISSLCRKPQQTHSIPVNRAPSGFGVPPFPVQGYNNPVYQAYAAQAHAYYSNMYMMNYMSQNALQHPGNPAIQKDRHAEKSQSASLHPGNQYCRHVEKSQNITLHPGNQGGRHLEKSQSATLHPGNQNGRNGVASSELEQTVGGAGKRNFGANKKGNCLVPDQTQSHSVSGLKLNCLPTSFTCEEPEEEKRQALVARQLLFMSNQRTKSTDTKPKETFQTLKQSSASQLVTKETYVVDHGRTVDFTKCISDVIDKTMKVQQKQTQAPPSIWNPAMAETRSQLSKTTEIGNQCSGKSDINNQVSCDSKNGNQYAGKSETHNQSKAENQYFRKTDTGEQCQQKTGNGNQSIVTEPVCLTSVSDCFPNYRLVPASSRRGTSLDTLVTPLQYSCPTLLYQHGSEDEVLNLSQKKMETNLDPPHITNIPVVTRIDSFHDNPGVRMLDARNYPASIGSCGQQPVQSYRHNPAGLYTHHAQSYTVPHPLTSTHQQPLTSNRGDNLAVGVGDGRTGKRGDCSNKIRRASCHDVGNPATEALDLRGSNSVMRSRHMSEILTTSRSAGVTSPTREVTEQVEAKLEEVGCKIDTKPDNCDSLSVNTLPMNKTLNNDSNSDENAERRMKAGNNVNAVGENHVQSKKKQSELCPEDEVRNKESWSDNTNQRKSEVGQSEVGTKDEVRSKESYPDSETSLNSRKTKTKVHENYVLAESETKESEVGRTSEDEENEGFPKTEPCTETDRFEQSVDKQRLKLTADEAEGIRDSNISTYGSEEAFDTTRQTDRTPQKVKPVHLNQTRESSTGTTCPHCLQVFPRPFDLQCHILKLHSRKNIAGDKVSPGIPSRSEAGALRMALPVSYELDQPDIQDKPEKLYKPEKQDELKQINQLESAEVSGKPYECNICLRRFAQKHNLNRHKMSHNSKSFECSVCRRSFKESFYLQMHIKVHANDSSQTCEICAAEIPKSEMLRHTQEHLGDIAENPTYEQIGGRVREILQGHDLNRIQGQAENPTYEQIGGQMREILQGQDLNRIQGRDKNTSQGHDMNTSQDHDLQQIQGADVTKGAQLMASKSRPLYGSSQDVSSLKGVVQNGKHSNQWLSAKPCLTPNGVRHGFALNQRNGLLVEDENGCLKKVRQAEKQKRKCFSAGNVDNVDQSGETFDTLVKIESKNIDQKENSENVNIPRTNDNNEANGRKVGQKALNQGKGNRCSEISNVLNMRKLLG